MSEFKAHPSASRSRDCAKDILGQTSAGEEARKDICPPDQAIATSPKEVSVEDCDTILLAMRGTNLKLDLECQNRYYVLEQSVCKLRGAHSGSSNICKKIPGINIATSSDAMRSLDNHPRDAERPCVDKHRRSYFQLQTPTRRHMQVAKTSQEHMAPAGRIATEMPGISTSFS